MMTGFNFLISLFGLSCMLLLCEGRPCYKKANLSPHRGRHKMILPKNNCCLF